MGWHYDAFCDWAPIRPRPLFPCAGGCGVFTETSEISGNFCYRCFKEPKKPVQREVQVKGQEAA